MAKNKKPNILWYCTDAQRYDTIGALGNGHIRTPNIDRLAAGGVAFKRAYSQSTLCTPSRASFLTGRYCASHHVYRNGAERFPPGEVLVTKMLADAGYDCALVGKLHISSSEKGETRYDDGYRVFHWSNMPYPGEAGDHLNAYHTWLREEKGVDPNDVIPRYRMRDAGRSHAGQADAVIPGLSDDLQQSRWINDMALRFVEEPREGPWLLSINAFEPHSPYKPPKEYLDRYDPATMPPPLFRPEDIERQKRFHGIQAQNVYARDPLDTALPSTDATSDSYGDGKAPGRDELARFNGRLVKCGYYAMIEMIDHHFGDLLESLDAIGELDNTIVIFQSDHGELLGDHGLVFKGARCFEGAVRVPLIMSWPEHIEKGIQSDALVELIDVAPTLLEAAGIETPYFVQGRSLLPMLSGDADPHVHKSVVLSEFHDSCQFNEGTDGPTQSVMSCDGRYKMVTYRDHDLGELFDLEVDPGEFTDLWDDPAHQSLKLEVMQRHVDAIMGSISAGPRRSTRY